MKKAYKILYYDKKHNDLLIFFRYKNRYCYQKYDGFYNDDPWKFQLYNFYKITSLKQLKKEMKKLNKNTFLDYDIHYVKVRESSKKRVIKEYFKKYYKDLQDIEEGIYNYER